MSKSRLEGFREAGRQLSDMKKATARGVGRRSLQVPAGILRDAMKQKARKLTHALEQSIEIGKEKAFKGRPRVNVTAADIASIQNEFGNDHQAASPFARPAADEKSGEMFDAFADALKREVDATVIKAAKG